MPLPSRSRHGRGRRSSCGTFAEVGSASLQGEPDRHPQRHVCVKLESKTSDFGFPRKNELVPLSHASATRRRKIPKSAVQNLL